MTPAEVIREARNVLFERGWTQDAAVAEDRSVCVVAALSIASTRLGREVIVRRDVFAPVRSAIGQGGRAVIDWNDDPDRTFSDVIDALDRAEKIAEARWEQ